MKFSSLLYLGLIGLLFTTSACDDDDGTPMLTIPTEYVSANFDANVVAENTVINELSTMTAAANAAESDAQTSTVNAIPYPTTLRAVTVSDYANLVDGWLVELVAAANSPDGFQIPALGESPAADQEGGLLGSRLLDENGLELEQMAQKGSFGAACYNHALDVIENGDLTDPGTIDKLVEIHGTEVTFDVSETTAAATYSRRRSDLTAETGYFYDIRNALLTAQAAIAGGRDFDTERDNALDAYLEAWEKSNFATVIYYANATITGLQNAGSQTGDERLATLGNALHAYAEGVGFAHGFKGVRTKQITDAQIDTILGLLLAPAGGTPTSFRFINEASLIANLEAVIDEVQSVYGFTDAEVTSFFVNNNP